MSSEKVEPIHPWRWRALTVWIVTFTVLVFGTLQMERQDARKADARIRHAAAMTRARVCARNDTLDGALLSILRRSLKGLPANAYYREHPGERVRARRNTQQAIDDLEAARC